MSDQQTSLILQVAESLTNRFPLAGSLFNFIFSSAARDVDGTPQDQFEETSLTHASPFTSLPAEIYQIILEHMTHRADVHSLLFTCRTMSLEAERCLYQTIDLSNLRVGTVTYSNGNEDPSRLGILRPNERCFAVITQLEKSERLARHVRQLILTHDYWWEIDRCLPQMSNLRFIRFINTYMSNFFLTTFLPLPKFGALKPSFHLISLDCHQLEPSYELAEFFKSQEELIELTWHPQRSDPLLQELFFPDEMLPRLEKLECTPAVADVWLRRRIIRALRVRERMILRPKSWEKFRQVEILHADSDALLRPGGPFVNLKYLQYSMPFPSASLRHCLLNLATDRPGLVLDGQPSGEWPFGIVTALPCSQMVRDFSQAARGHGERRIPDDPPTIVHWDSVSRGHPFGPTLAKS